MPVGRATRASFQWPRLPAIVKWQRRLVAWDVCPHLVLGLYLFDKYWLAEAPGMRPHTPSVVLPPAVSIGPDLSPWTPLFFFFFCFFFFFVATFVPSLRSV